MRHEVQEAINSYVTDMLALEDHIEKALDTQVKDFEEEFPRITAELRTIHHQCQAHIRDLKTLSDQQDTGGVAEAVKRAGAALAGLGAAAIDKVRNEKLPKNLRDDYTAIHLAAIGYSMLFTTARSLDQPRVAQTAERHLRDYAQAVTTLHDTIPEAVVEFLRRDELPARSEVVPEVVRDLREVWRSVREPTSEAAFSEGIRPSRPSAREAPSRRAPRAPRH